MKKILTWVLLYLFLASATALAQEAVIIELDGDVQVQFNESSEWEKAAEGQALKRQSRVKTGDDGRAIIAFGEGRSNIINIDKNTNIVIEEVKPGAVFLPSGRVFSIIRELSQIENFEVKTPTAVAGARGTGWITEFSEGQTRIAV